MTLLQIEFRPKTLTEMGCRELLANPVDDRQRDL